MINKKQILFFTSLILTLIIISLLIITKQPVAYAFTPPPSFKALDTFNGGGLYKTIIPGKQSNNEAYLQVFHLPSVRIDQIVGEVDDMAWGKGQYYSSNGQSYSPFFKMKLFSEVKSEYKQLYNGTFISLINCSFFEQYQASSQLSFPIKFNGQVITGGNSPYGPVKQPADKYYGNIQLKALVWDDKKAYITDYDAVNGAPLNNPQVKNAIVTYKYSDHPSKVLANNQVNKFHVMGTMNQDNIPGDELLLILTVNKANLDEAASLLKQVGVKGDIITIDGGSSTFISNHRLGDIMLPTPVNPGNGSGLGNIILRKLPHYLGFRLKTKTQTPPQIFISKPAKQWSVKANQPYLILWRDNFDDDVKIDLYKGNKFIQNITRRTASDGVYEWAPKFPITSGYQIRISSLKNQKVFATWK